MKRDSEFANFARMALIDALQAAIQISSRAADEFEGTPTGKAFSDMSGAIIMLRDRGQEQAALARAITLMRRSEG